MDESLTILAYMCDTVQVILKNFLPYKWKGNCIDALRHNNNNCNIMNTFLYDNIAHFNAKDNLYIGTIKSKDQEAAKSSSSSSSSVVLTIYSSEHLICSNMEGHSTLDILYRGNLNYDSIACTPKYKYRTYDNKSVEFYYLDKPLHEKYITIGLHSEKYGGEYLKELLYGMGGFLDNVRTFFNRTFYIPYLIHPYRLVLLKKNVVKLISGNLLQYVLCPYAPTKKLCDILFTHPNIIKNYKSKKRDDKKVFLKLCTNNIIIDFFHSFFVTILWILLCENYNNLDLNRQSCNGFFKEHEKLYEFMKRKKQKSKDFLEKSNKKNEDDNNNNNLDHSCCKNGFGYCQTNHLDENQRKLIHDYGCEHLNSTFPAVLDVVLNMKDRQEAITQLRQLVDQEFLELMKFICDILTTVI